MILYHKTNLVYLVVFPQFLIFQQNNSAQSSALIFFTSRHYYFFLKLKIVEKQLCKLNCSYGKVSHTLKIPSKLLVEYDMVRESPNKSRSFEIFFFIFLLFQMFEKLFFFFFFIFYERGRRDCGVSAFLTRTIW